MFLLGPTVVYSASDLTAAATCEWATMHRLDAKLGRVELPKLDDDDMLARTAKLGDAHELRVLADLRDTRDVVEIARPQNPTEVEEVASQTSVAFEGGADVVYQAAFFDGRFLGYADFILRSDDGSYEVYDTKLARHAKITALLQLAAYSEQLQRLGIRTGERVHLWLGDMQVSSHRLQDILPVYRNRRARLERIIDERLADTAPTAWGDERYAACGRCDYCTEQVELHRDVLLVAGLRLTQRDRLRAAGISTIEQLAEAPDSVDGMSNATLRGLREQARIQLSPVSEAAPLAWEIADASVLAALPTPDAGDIFFDFEGDPLYQEGDTWGLDYLFGLVENDGTFRPFWAHDLPQEKRALVEFLEYVVERRVQHPAMHIYHYASYERTHLLTLAARHGVGGEIVDSLLRDHVLVDLYPIVRRGLRIGSHSYSLKKLEPLYMLDARQGVANAADSITEYVRARELQAAGETDAAAQVIADIARYNTYDCLSTLRLRDWLLARAAEQAVPLADFDELRPPHQEAEPDPLYGQLMALIEDTSVADRDPTHTGIALAAAALDYHRRENNSFWWDHFDRLRNPIDEWEGTRDVFRIDDGGVEVIRDWSVVGRDKSLSRDLLLTGTPAPGSSFKAGDTGQFVVYDDYAPADVSLEPGARWAHEKSELLEVDEVSFLLREKIAVGADPIADLPIALAPSKPPPSKTLVEAIRRWASEVLAAWPRPFEDPAMDVLRRASPRTALAPIVEERSDAIVASLLPLRDSYLAVQGPPGTGKTYVGSKVIVELVRDHGWKIGVVAQSHSVVEHMLDGIVKAGLDPALVGKKPKDDSAQGHWTKLTDRTQGAFTAQNAFVLGGTQWTFANDARIPARSLDLLVVDEAGQFSLANTIAASVSAQRMLLLGDPQQLPQVTKGTHPEPVDTSALGWLSAGHDVLPPEFGYFLETSWRMHPDVCAPVSRLSYEGKLHSHDSDRSLAGIVPGLHPVPLAHHGNSTLSIEEADAVVALARDLLGRDWSSKGVTAPLEQDNIIVVAPYNAQVETIKLRLEAAGFADIPVGTVDKFQGREAAVSIISLSASSAADVPRGLEFLLLANRLNVAISRAQWASYLIYSPGLTEALPTSVAGLAQLSAFIELLEG